MKYIFDFRLENIIVRVLLLDSLYFLVNAVAPTVTIHEAEVYFTIIQRDGTTDKVHSKVKPDSSGSGEFTQFVRRFEKNRVFTFNNDTISVTFKCSAPYRVTWAHTQDTWLSRTSINWLKKLSSQTIFYQRTVQNIQDQSTYQYSALLRLYNQEYDVGQFVCQSGPEVVTGSAAESEKIAVFRERYPGQVALALARLTPIPIWTNERTDGNLILPCYVRDSQPKVTLFKKSALRGKWDPISGKHQLRFVPELGFVYNDKNLLESGLYKCSAGNDDDFVLVSLIAGDQPQATQDQQYNISPEASFSVVFNESSNLATVKCCSSSSKAPVLTTASCENRDECEKQLKFNPTLKITSNYVNPQQVGNCQEASTLLQFLPPLQAVCSGDGVKVRELILIPEFYINLGAIEGFTMKPSKSWDQLDSVLLVDFFSPDGHWDENGLRVLKNQQKVTFICRAVPWYFARGNWVVVNYSSGSSMRVTKGVRLSEFGDRWVGSVFETIVTPEMKSVSCHVPEISAGRWTSKTIGILVE